jgi:hypothetical protein
MSAEGVEGGLGGDVGTRGLVDPVGLVVEKVVVIGRSCWIGIATPQSEA